MERYQSAILSGEFDKVASVEVGTRRNTLLRAAVKLGSYVAGGVLSREVVYWGLIGSAEGFKRQTPAMLEKEIVETINAGINHGGSKPRNVFRVV